MFCVSPPSWLCSLENDSFWQEMLYKKARRNKMWRHLLEEVLKKSSAFVGKEDSRRSTHQITDVTTSASDDLKNSLRRYRSAFESRKEHLDNRSNSALPSMRQIFCRISSVAERFSQFWSCQDENSPTTSGSDNEEVRLAHHDSGIQSVLHFTTRRRIAVGHRDGVVRCYQDEPPFSVLEDYRASEAAPINVIASFQRFLVTGAGTADISFWDLVDVDQETVGANKLATPAPPRSVLEFRHDAGPICFLKIRGNLLIASNYSGLVCVWRIESGIAETTSSSSSFRAHMIFSGNGLHWEMDVDVDPHYVASASSDGLRLWNLEDGALLRCVVDEEFRDTAVLSLPDEDFLIVGTDGGVLKMIRKSTGKVIGRFRRGGADDASFTSPVIRLERLEGRHLAVTYLVDAHCIWDLDVVITRFCSSLGESTSKKSDGGVGEVLSIPPESAFRLEANRVDYSRENIVYSAYVAGEVKICVVRRPASEM